MLDLINCGFYRLIQADAAIGTVLDLWTRQPERRGHRNGLAESGAAFGAAYEQDREDGAYKAEHADEGKVAGSRPPKAHVARKGDKQPRDEADSKSPPHSALDVVADRHCSLPRGSVHRFAEAQTAMNAMLWLWRLISTERNGSESDKSSAARTANSAYAGQIDSAGGEQRAESDGGDRGPGPVLSAPSNHTHSGQPERQDHKVCVELATFNEFADGLGRLHGLRFYPALRISP